jgi:hypothetical protein
MDSKHSLAPRLLFLVMNRVRNMKASMKQECNMKPLSTLGWYRILRAHHQWTIFQSIRYALWLAR